MQIVFVAAASAAKDALAAPLFESDGKSPGAERLERESGGLIGRALAGGRFTGGKGQSLELVAPGGLSASRLWLGGAGGKDGFDAAAAETFAAGAFAAVKASGAATLSLLLDGYGPEIAAKAAFGVDLAAYRFDKYRTKEKPEKKPSLTKVEIVCDDPKAAQAAYAPLKTLNEAISYARDLVSEPPNVLYPASYADRVKDLTKLGLEVEVLGIPEMTKLGMGALLGVGQGSSRDSRLVVMRWNGAADKKAQPVAFVGKGVTFDTGGISIKPADGMEDMKWDMGGSAAVVGVMHALAGRKAKVNAVGVIGLVENMPDGNAQRPGDVVTTMSGQTIEVINTDAEGRLVLADALWYTKQKFNPKFMVDLATLTGAIIIALGHDYAGLYSNNDELSTRLTAAGEGEGELLWRMPLPASYEKQIESMIADMKNIGGRPAGSATAALLLQRFVDGAAWAHLDIAGVTWKKPSTAPTTPDGASGFGVRLLNRLVAEHYEG